MDLILASTSRYRKSLLERLQIPFRCQAPGTDESPLAGEAPEAMARRLALSKAWAVAQDNPESLVIGSDQVASLEGRPVGKPGNHARAREQLHHSSGKSIIFYTGLALIRASDGFEHSSCVAFTVHFRELSEAQIEAYLAKEQPFDCAGSFKCEGLGIALFASTEGEDITALEGLPLIALTSALSAAGLEVLQA